MKICIPVLGPVGKDFQINPDMRNTEALLLVDSATGFEELKAVESSACQSVPDEVDTVICSGGVGLGMFNGWMARGIRVFYAEDALVSEVLSKFKVGTLLEVVNTASCGCGSHEGGGCHGHDHGDGGCYGHSHGHGGCGCH